MAAACRTATAPQSVPPVPPPPDRGTVAATLLPDPDAPSYRLRPGEDYVAPRFSESNALPEYPATLIASRLAPHVVAVRMFLDESGCITDISESPVQASTDTIHRPMFEAAVQNALLEWSVRPPSIRRFKPGPDLDQDGKSDYQVLVEQVPFKTYFDLAFTFEIVNGRAIVKSAENP